MSYSNISVQNEEDYNVDKLNSRNDDFTKSMILIFVKMAREYLQEAQKAMEENNLAEINRLAHWIKPSVEILSIHSVYSKIRDLEHAESLSLETKEKVSFTIQKLEDIASKMELKFR